MIWNISSSSSTANGGRRHRARASKASIPPPPSRGRWSRRPAREDVDRAVAAADRALFDPAWTAMTQTARGKLLMRLADLLIEHADELGRLETVDSGKLLKETRSQAAANTVVIKASEIARHRCCGSAG